MFVCVYVCVKDLKKDKRVNNNCFKMKLLGTLEAEGESNHPIVVSKRKILKKIILDFNWEGCGTLPKNSYKPSQDLWKATL